MNNMEYNRYKQFTNNGAINLVPFIKIPETSSDYYVRYETNKTRLDLLSYEYYNDANFGWLILQANPEVPSLEFNIPNNTVIRIPYPLNAALASYNNGVAKYKQLYGLK